MTPQEWCDQLVETAWKPVLRTIDVANDDFIRTTEERHTAPGAGLPAVAVRRRRDLRGPVRRARTAWPARSSSCPASSLDGEGDYAARVCAIHAAGRAAVRAQLLLPAVQVRRRAARALPRPPRVRRSPRRARNEVRPFVARGCRTCRSPGRRSTGASRVPWDDEPRRLRVDRRAAQLRHRRGLGAATRRAFASTVAGRRPPRRQGHPAVPRRDLAGDADGRRAAVAAQGLRPRLAARRRREDEQVQADRHRAARIIDHFGSDAFRYYFLRELSSSARTGRSRGSTWPRATRASWPTSSATSPRG